MKIWDKGIETESRIEAFTVGKDPVLDLRLAPFDVQASRAHAQMLAQTGIISAEEGNQLTEELDRIAAEIQEGSFEIEPGMEDVHSQLELTLTRRLGESGKKIHAGRSRNDQVLVALKLYFKSEIEEIAGMMQDLCEGLLQKSEAHKHQLMPGYTHLQAAMPSSFGMWFAAFAETFADDLLWLQAAYTQMDQNPLGSAAGYGNSFPLDREFTTEALGFADMHVNSIAAQLARGKSERFLTTAIAGIASTLAKIAGDLCLWSGQDFGFFQLPDAYTTGSSIMPHKKNPDVFELIRAKCNLLTGLPAQLDRITGNLSTGYHRDFQEIKGIAFEAIDSLKSCLDIFTFSLPNIKVQEKLLSEDKYLYTFSVEEVNRLVLEGLPFRDAYKQVAADIEAGTFTPKANLSHSHTGSLGNLGNEQIAAKIKARLKPFFARNEAL